MKSEMHFGEIISSMVFYAWFLRGYIVSIITKKIKINKGNCETQNVLIPSAYEGQVTTFYILNIYSFICQLYFNKAEKSWEEEGIYSAFTFLSKGSRSLNLKQDIGAGV